MYCIEINSNVDHVRSICADMNLLRFVPKDEFKIATTEKEAKENVRMDPSPSNTEQKSRFCFLGFVKALFFFLFKCLQKNNNFVPKK